MKRWAFELRDNYSREDGLIDVGFSTEKIIYRSVNKGESWETSKLETPGHVEFLVIDPSNPETIYIGIGELQAAKKGPLF